VHRSELKLAVPVLLGALLAGSAGAQAAQPSRVVEQGIAIELTVEPVAAKRTEVREGDDAAVRFRITDTATGSPLSGVAPAAWMELLADGALTDPKDCTRKVEQFLGGDLFSRPDVDLNNYFVLALNDDATISVVDPLFGFGGTKLLAMVELRSPGEDWVLSADKSRLFVSQPEAGRVAMVDTASWQLLADLELGPRPARLALQPDGVYLWVALEGGVAAVDVRNLRVTARIPLPAGRRDLVISDDNRFVFVANLDAHTVSVIDVVKLAGAGDVDLGSAPASIAFSSLAKAAYVTSESAGTITAVSMSTGRPRIAARLQAEPGLGQVRFAPRGRLGFAVNPRNDRVHVFDAARNRVVQTASVQEGPDQVTFSDHLAYIRHRGSEVVMMIPLEQLGKEGTTVPVIDFPGGEHPLGQGARSSSADSIVRAPGATAVLVANPADKAIFYYKEGMAAPMGSFQNYGRQPRAVLVVDRSLKERQPGTYSTVARLPQPGRYRVAFFLDSPRMVRCFEVAVAPSPELAEKRRREAPVIVEHLTDLSLPLVAGRRVHLRFRLTDPRTGAPAEGLDDVNVLAVLSPGMWHQTLPARSTGNGIYETDLVPPVGGAYFVAVECLSQKLPANRSPQMGLNVAEPGAAASP
jgi:YVTN family beta-propeller protein